MKVALLLFLLLTTAHANFSDDQYPQSTDILSRIITAAQAYGAPLSSGNENKIAYYLRSAEYIGSCEAPFGRVHAARLFYIRSAPQEVRLPARGHTFIVFLNSTLKIRMIWKVDPTLGRLHFEGTQLWVDKTDLFDFASPPANKSVILDGEPFYIPQWKSR